MGGNILFLGKKIFEIPPFFQTRPGDLGKKVYARSLRFSALKSTSSLGAIYHNALSQAPITRGQHGGSLKEDWQKFQTFKELYSGAKSTR